LKEATSQIHKSCTIVCVNMTIIFRNNKTGLQQAILLQTSYLLFLDSMFSACHLVLVGHKKYTGRYLYCYYLRQEAICKSLVWVLWAKVGTAPVGRQLVQC